MELRKLENKIQQEIFEWYNNTRCLKIHSDRQMMFHIPNENQYKLVNIGVLGGVSDLVMTHQGEWVFIEVKTLTGKLSKKQEDFLDRLTVLGTRSFTVRSLNEFKELIQKLDEEKNSNK